MIGSLLFSIFLARATLAPAQASPSGAAVSLAPTIVDLQESEARLARTLEDAHGVEQAMTALQAAWTRAPARAREDCRDQARLELGWRLERFGAAWRELAQAARAEATRMASFRGAATVSPLVEERRREAGERLLADAEATARAVLRAGVWQERFVRPALAACPLPGHLPPGVDLLDGPGGTAPRARNDAPAPLAVLALGDGWICSPGTEARRADDAVLLLASPKACWSSDAACGCAPRALRAGAVLGPWVEPAVSEGAEDPLPVGAGEAGRRGP
jgi:hypothetical protein